MYQFKNGKLDGGKNAKQLFGIRVVYAVVLEMFYTIHASKVSSEKRNNNN